MKLIWLSFLAVASAGSPDQLTCAIDGAGALDSAVSAGVYLWASTQRCAQGKNLDGLKCEIDVASALKSVIDMVDIIVGAVDKCAGRVQDINAQCGQAVGKLASSFAGLTAGGGALTHWIQKKSQGGNVVIDATTTNIGKCVIDVKSIANDIFQAAAGIKAATAGCSKEKGETCAANALAIVSVLSNMGSALSHSVAHCTAKGNQTALMSGDIIGLVSTLDSVAAAGIGIDQKCKVPESRLYAAIQNTKASSFVSMNGLILAALVPVAAIIGFMGGRRNKQMNQGQIRDIERMGIISLGEEVIEQTDRE